MRARVVLAGVLLATSVSGTGVMARPPASRPVAAPVPVVAGFVYETDEQVKRDEPAPHQGRGRTTAYRFFEDAPGMGFAFRKRVLHAGASIGYHKQQNDEVTYVLNGSGKMTVDGRTFPIKPGDAILTRTDSSHGIEQDGPTDLTVMIVFPLRVARGAPVSRT